MKTTNQSAAITVWEIKERDFTRFGIKYEGAVAKGHHAEIVPGKSITLFGHVEAGSRYVKNAAGQYVPCEAHDYRRMFEIGDTAEYDSYNLSYLGTIRAITAKTITIVDYEGTCNEKVRRLTLAEFDRRNWDLDVAETVARNADLMQTL